MLRLRGDLSGIEKFWLVVCFLLFWPGLVFFVEKDSRPQGRGAFAVSWAVLLTIVFILLSVMTKASYDGSGNVESMPAFLRFFHDLTAPLFDAAGYWLSFAMFFAVVIVAFRVAALAISKRG